LLPLIACFALLGASLSQGELPAAYSGQEVAELARAIDLAAQADLQGLLIQGFKTFEIEVGAYRGENAHRLALSMHQRAQAPWSAVTLGIVSTRTGRHAQATQTLRNAISMAPDYRTQGELRGDLAIALIGAGKEKRALEALGSSYARGSVNAGLVLGRIALREGQMPKARAIFRTLLDVQPAQAWAHRGWGLAMLPRPDAVSLPGNSRSPVTPPL
jgi:Flp pilus assembly protein TadD